MHFFQTFQIRKEYGQSLYNFVKDSVRHNNPDYSKQEFYPAPAIEVYSYRDLGTWDSINEFVSNEDIKEYYL